MKMRMVVDGKRESRYSCRERERERERRESFPLRQPIKPPAAQKTERNPLITLMLNNFPQYPPNISQRPFLQPLQQYLEKQRVRNEECEGKKKNKKMSYYFTIINTRDAPLFELEFGTSKAGGDGAARFSPEARAMNPFIVHSSLDIVDELRWGKDAMYLLLPSLSLSLSTHQPPSIPPPSSHRHGEGTWKMR